MLARAASKREEHGILMVTNDNHSALTGQDIQEDSLGAGMCLLVRGVVGKANCSASYRHSLYLD